MAGSIPQSFIDDLLERLDIVEVIDSRVKLKKSGKNYSACCPFHDEKTPSFSVSPDKQFFYCFGCGASGNSLGFVMDYERISFPEAVDSLAKLAGVDVPREQTQDPKKRAREEAQERARKTLYNLMVASSDYYQEQLRSHTNKSRAVNYLKNRGLSGQIAKAFGIGYAPAGWDNLLNEVGSSNEKQDLLLEGGMLIYNEEKDRRYDRFRERIMFPIRDNRGRIIGFGGRVLNDEKPKYLNSPETPIFHKGKELYGLYEARQAYRQLPRLLVVEGYMDVVALAQYGIAYGVATLGTACGVDHLTRAFRFTNEVVFCFDGDDAGRKAARRAMENALPVMEDGRQIKFLYLPDGEDPDTLIRQIGADKFTRLIESASPLEQFLFEELSQDINVQTMEGRARLCKLTAPMIDMLPRGVYRELMFQQLSNRTQLSIDALMNLLQELPEVKPTNTPHSQHEQTAHQQPVKHTSSTSHDHHEHYPPDYDEQSNHTLAPSDNAAPYSNDYENYGETSDSHHSNYDTPSTSQRQGKREQVPNNPHFLVEERASALLLYSPQLINDINDIELLKYSQNNHVKTFVSLAELISQRPNFTPGQIVGHWQGTYGIEASRPLEQYMLKAALFHRAQEMASKEEKCQFNPSQELNDTIGVLGSQQDQTDCERIIEQLNHKPRQEWSDDEKRLYQKAILARSH